MRKKNSILGFALALTLLAVAAGCTKPAPEGPTTTDVNNKIYLLSEGLWGGNNAEISLLDRNSENVVADWFGSNNQRGLGDLAQDMIHYGNKLYVTVFTSNVLEVIDPETGISIRQIDFGHAGPRYLAGHEGKVYVSCYDKTIARIDTATLEIESKCNLSGLQPEQLCVVGNKLYVCNSWQRTATGGSAFDSTLSVVDLGSFSETGKITVGLNPGRIKALPNNRVIVACGGDYGENEAKTVVVNTMDNSMETLAVAATNFDVKVNDIYMYATTYDAGGNARAVFYHADANTLQTEEILKEHTAKLNNTYGLNIDPKTGNLYICNSIYNANADVYTLKPDGTLVRKVEGGIFSSKVVF